MKVIAVQQARDAETGAPSYQIAFGRMAQLSEAIKTRIAEGGQPIPQATGSEIGLNSVVLFIPTKGVASPYRLGSEWDLEVGADGSVSLTEVKS